MKNILCILTIVSSVALLAGSVEDSAIVFSTKGPDLYSDGTAVLDGESYALVWTKDGVFEGFFADGKVIDEEDKLLLTAPIAKDGHCPRVMFQIPVKDAVNYGRYDVFLLDTRIVSSADDKKIVPRTDAKLVNGYGRVHAEITLSAFSNKSEGSVVANMNSAAPKDAMQPRVKSMRIVGDQVILEVENIPGFMRVQSGRDTSAADSTGVALETPENSDTVTLIAPKTGDKGFYRVIHNPSK
jgi:hypothetical protein